MSEGPKKSKISASRRLALKTKLLKKAESLLVAETEEKKLEREKTLSERVPPLKLSGLSLQDLQRGYERSSDNSTIQVHTLVFFKLYDAEICLFFNLTNPQTLCKELHHKIDVVDEERYDIAAKVSKNDKEIENLTQKIFELKGKMKRPALKRVKISAEAMLGALLGGKVKETVDFKSNLKTVKKEEEKKEEVTDWRKNVEAMSGMEGRKKLFDAGQ